MELSKVLDLEILRLKNSITNENLQEFKNKFGNDKLKEKTQEYLKEILFLMNLYTIYNKEQDIKLKSELNELYEELKSILIFIDNSFYL